jgi:hypothetical protein
MRTYCGRIAVLEEKADQHDCAIVVLQDKLKQLSSDFWASLQVKSLNTLVCCSGNCGTFSSEVSALKEQIASGLHERAVEELSTKFDDLRKEVPTLKTQIAGLPSLATRSIPILLPPSPQQPPVPSTLSLDSQIISGTFRKFSQSSLSFRFCGVEQLRWFQNTRISPPM